MHAIDTHKAVTRLETTGMSRQTAEAVVEIFDTVANAAATDLAEFKTEIIRWNVGSIVAMAAVMIVAVKLI